MAEGYALNIAERLAERNPDDVALQVLAAQILGEMPNSGARTLQRVAAIGASAETNGRFRFTTQAFADLQRICAEPCRCHADFYILHGKANRSSNSFGTD
jgi:hypothetical protein